METNSPVMDAYEVWEEEPKNHRAGVFPTHVLRTIEQMLPSSVKRSAETGCGKTTTLFSNLSAEHTVFCIDDREYGVDSSVLFYSECPITKLERVHRVFGPTQRTLPTYQHAGMYDI